MAGTGTWGGLTDPRIFRIRATWTAAGSKCSTGFQLRGIGGGTMTPADAADVADDVFNHTDFLSILHTNDRLVSVDAVNIETAEGFTIAYPNTPGTAGGEEAPSALMVPLNLVGGIRRRYANGRMFMPVRTESDVAVNTLHSGGVTRFDAFIARLADVTNVGDTIGTYFLTHAHAAKPARPKADGGTLPAVPASYYDITAIVINRNISWVRSRKAGVGS